MAELVWARCEASQAKAESTRDSPRGSGALGSVRLFLGTAGLYAPAGETALGTAGAFGILMFMLLLIDANGLAEILLDFADGPHKDIPALFVIAEHVEA